MERPQFYRYPQMKINNETFIHSGGPHGQKIIAFVSLWLFMNKKAFSERNELIQNFPKEIQMFKNVFVSNRLIYGKSLFQIHER